MNPRGPFEYEEKRGFLRRYGFVIGLLVVAAVGVVLFKNVFSGRNQPAPYKPAELVMLKLAPPPPPPPPAPPPPPQDQPKQEMMEKTPVDAEEAKPDATPDPTPALGTNVQGNGPADGFGLGRNGNGTIGGRGGNRAGSRFGWYAAEVIKSLGDALRENPQTRNASFDVKVRVWANGAGRITRAKLAESTGDLALDDAIKAGVLEGFQLPEPPPDGMPMPIVMRLAARRPN